MRVYALNTLKSGEDTIDLVRDSIPIQGVIGLSKRANSELISGYSYQQELCSQFDLPYIDVATYGLISEPDKAAITSLEIDILLVVGWQRLIPKWLIDHCRICAIGVHGSPFGITKGRGRSPQNWAILMGERTFDVSIFEIDDKIDSGRVFDTRSFVYSEFDDIKTSYYKSSILTARMIADLLRQPEFYQKSFPRQSECDAEYLPQRQPSDGAIDWNASNSQIRNLVRALTRPYPGARTSINGSQIQIWHITPFAIDFASNSYRTGEIVKVFGAGDFLVRTRAGYMLVDDFESDGDGFRPKAGMMLESADWQQQIQSIIQRHEEKYPMLKVSKSVQEFLLATHDH